MDSKRVKKLRYLKICEGIEQTYCKLIRHYNWSIRSSRNFLKKYGMDKDTIEMIHSELYYRYLVKQDLLRIQGEISKISKEVER